MAWVKASLALARCRSSEQRRQTLRRRGSRAAVSVWVGQRSFTDLRGGGVLVGQVPFLGGVVLKGN